MLQIRANPSGAKRKFKESRFYCGFFGAGSQLTNQHLNLTISGPGLTGGGGWRGNGGEEGPLQPGPRSPRREAEVGGAGSDERLRGGQSPERAFITPLTGRQGPGGRREDVPSKEASSRSGSKGAFNSPMAPSIPDFSF